MTDTTASAPDARIPAGRTSDDGYVPSAKRLERERYRRSRRARSRMIATGCTAGAALAVAGLAVSSPGWANVRRTFLSWHEFTRTFPDILDGFWLNVRMFLVAEVVILVVGLLIAVLRSTRGPGLLPLRLAATLYVDVFRGTPTLLIIFVVGFGLPALQLSGTPRDPWVLGVIALVLSYGAYVAEVFRAGLNSVHPSQRNAAKALGLTDTQTLRHVILPQAVRNVAPPLLNDFVSLQKDTALVATIGPLEALRQAQIPSAYDFNYTPYLGAALLFIIATIPLARYTDRLQTRATAKQWAGAR